jgi:hypothetical protein
MHKYFAVAGAVVALLLLCVETAFAQQFEFAGLSLKTTRADAAKRYPTSDITERHVYVSAGDAHDDISAIELPDGRAGTGRLKVFFERRTAQEPGYPSCEAILAILRPRYGEPGTVQRSSEEQDIVRRMLWRRGAEELTLICFSRDARALSAEALVIARLP